jgi:hypothetical protein
VLAKEENIYAQKHLNKKQIRPMLTVAQKSKTKMAATFDFEFF